MVSYTLYKQKYFAQTEAEPTPANDNTFMYYMHFAAKKRKSVYKRRSVSKPHHPKVKAKLGRGFFKQEMTWEVASERNPVYKRKSVSKPQHPKLTAKRGTGFFKQEMTWEIASD